MYINILTCLVSCSSKESQTEENRVEVKLVPTLGYYFDVTCGENVKEQYQDDITAGYVTAAEHDTKGSHCYAVFKDCADITDNKTRAECKKSTCTTCKTCSVKKQGNYLGFHY